MEHCLFCDHSWSPRLKGARPLRCPRCGAPCGYEPRAPARGGRFRKPPMGGLEINRFTMPSFPGVDQDGRF